MCKTTCASALALAFAARGERVLLAEVNGGDRISALLGADPVGPDMREVQERLHLVDMNPRAAIREYALLTFRFESVYSAVFENRFVKHFLRLVPSLSELVMLGKIWFHYQEGRDTGRPRFDRIVIDAPATGHAISMLSAPRVVERTVPPGPLRDNAQNIAKMLQSSGHIHIVTTPEEMPVNEARELERAAADLIGIKVGTTFINRRLAALSEAALDALESDDRCRALGASLKRRQHKWVLGEEQLQRLPAGMLRDSVRFPRRVIPKLDAEARRALAERVSPEPM